MKGDFTRFTFRPEKHYSSVRMQQGRVQLDADWNEQVDITAHRIETEAADVIGRCGGPLGAAGFQLNVDASGKHITIGRGRYYVDGILCENEADVDLDQQPDLPGISLDNLADGFYLAYLDVWQRHITALEDEEIREVALGGPDTATRTKTVWQVKLLGPIEGDGELTCASEPEAWKALVDRSQDGKLSARAQPSTPPSGPCLVPERAGYRRLENQLYRVEVHEVDRDGKVKTLKWSRDNASIVTRWLGQEASKPEEIIVASIGRDEVLRFGPGQYVELTDEQRELRGEAGILVRLANAEGQVLTLDPTDPNTATVNRANFPDTLAGRLNHPKARRWDGIIQDPKIGEWLDLEDGVQIRLDGGTYHVGDYWLIPARTITGDVEWPRNATGNPIPQPRAGIEHHYCRLTVVRRKDGRFTVVQDCRDFFSPLTGLVALLYVGGDGQEAPPGQSLPLPLQVRVVNIGSVPVVGAQVRFTVTQGGGSLSVTQPVATTAPDGIAECRWTLGAGGPQQVTAELLDADGNPVPGQVLHFGATVSTARRGGCCISVGPGGDYDNLYEALRDRIARGEREICLCVLSGNQEVGGFEMNQPDLRVQITGCGPGSRLILREPLRFVNLRSVILRDLDVEFAFRIEPDNSGLAFDHCALVEIRGCQVSGVTVADPQATGSGSLLFISDADRVVLADNVFEALRPDTLQLASGIFRSSRLSALADLYGLPDPRELRRSEFDLRAMEAARALAALSADVRERARRLFTEALSQLNLSPAERFSYGKFVSMLGAKSIDPEAAYDVLLDIRRAAVKTRPGTAIVLGRPRPLPQMPISGIEVFDQDDFIRVENNEIAGILSLYGPPAPSDLVDQLLRVDPGRLKEKRILSIGSLGTLQLRSNQIVRVAVSREIVQELGEVAEAQSLIGLFDRCQWSDNVFEGGSSLVVCRHLTLQGNEWTQWVGPQAPADSPALAATVIAESAIYVANHGPDKVQIRNISRLVERVANQQIEIV